MKHSKIASSKKPTLANISILSNIGLLNREPSELSAKAATIYIFISKFQIFCLNISIMLNYLENPDWASSTLKPLSDIALFGRLFDFGTSESELTWLFFLITQIYSWGLICILTIMLVMSIKKQAISICFLSFFSQMRYPAILCINFMVSSFNLSLLRSYFMENSAFSVGNSVRTWLILSIFSLIVVNLWTFIQIHLFATCFKTKNALSSKSSVDELLEFIEKVFLLAIIELSYDSKTKKLALFLLSAIFSWSKLVVYSIYIPYYNQKMMKLIFCSQVFLAFFSALGLFTCTYTVISGIHPNKFIYFFTILLFPFIYKTGSLIHEKLIFNLIANEDRGSFQLILKASILLDLISGFPTISSNKLKLTHDQLVHMGYWQQIDNSQKPCLNSHHEAEVYEKCLIFQILKILNLGVQKYSKCPELKVFYIDLLIQNKSSPLLILSELDGLMKYFRSTKVDICVQILLNRIEGLIRLKEGLAKNSLFLEEVFKIKDAEAKLKEKIKTQLDTQKIFWDLFKEPEIGFQNLIDLSKKIEREKNVVSRFWANIEKLNLISREGILIYSTYINQANNRPFQQNELVKKYKKVLSKQNEKVDFEKDLGISNDKKIFIEISASKSTLGEIIDCSTNIEEILGYSKSELIGNNIKYIMSGFFASLHQEKLNNYFLSGKEKIIGECQNLFAMHKKGFLSPISLLVRPNSDIKNRISFLSAINLQAKYDECILIKKSGFIDGLTEKIGGLLNFQRNEQIHIDRLSKNLFAKICKAFEENEQTNLKSTNTELDLLTTQDLLKVSTADIVTTVSPREKISSKFSELRKMKTFSSAKNKNNSFELELLSLDRKQTVKCLCEIMMEQYGEYKIYMLNILKCHIDFLASNFTRGPKYTHEPSEANLNEEKSIFNTKKVFNQLSKSTTLFPKAKTHFPEDQGQALIPPFNNSLREHEQKKTFLNQLNPDYPRNEHLENKSLSQEPSIEKEKSEQSMSFKSYALIIEEKSKHLNENYNTAVSVSSSVRSNRVQDLKKFLERGLEFVYIEPCIAFFFKSFILLIIAILLLVFVNERIALTVFDETSQKLELLLDEIKRVDAMGQAIWATSLVQVIRKGYYTPTPSVIDTVYTQFKFFWDDMSERNLRFHKQIGNYNAKVQEEFYKTNIPIYDIDPAIDKLIPSSMRRLNTFDALSSFHQISLKFTRSPNGTKMKDADLEFLIQNSYNDLLLESERHYEILQKDLLDNLENASSNFDAITLFGIGIIIILFASSLLIIRKLNSESYKFGNILARLNEDDVNSIKSNLSQIRFLIDDSFNFEPKEEEHQAKVSKNNTGTQKYLRKLRKFNYSKSKFTNFGLVIRLWPIILLFCANLVYDKILFNNSVTLTKFLEKQSFFALYFMYITDVAFASGVLFVTYNDTLPLRKQDMVSQFLDIIHLHSDIEEFVNNYKDINGDLSSWHKYLFYSQACNDTLTNVFPTDYKICMDLSGDGVLGMLNLNAAYYLEQKTYTQDFLKSQRNEAIISEFMERHFNVLWPTNVYQNNYLVALAEHAQENFHLGVQKVSNQIVQITGMTISLGVIFLIMCYYFVLRRIKMSSMELKAMILLIPFDVIIRYNNLKQYLLKTSGPNGRYLKSIV